MRFRDWLNREVDLCLHRRLWLAVALIMYASAFFCLFGNFIPVVVDEASAACYRGTQASWCTYPSTRPKCNDYK